jgi:hypothetical protein
MSRLASHSHATSERRICAAVAIRASRRVRLAAVGLHFPRRPISAGAVYLDPRLPLVLARDSSRFFFLFFLLPTKASPKIP